MAAKLDLIEKLLDAGYTKEEIDNITAEQSGVGDAKETPEEDQAPIEPEADKPDILGVYKEQIDAVLADIQKATEEIQKFNLRHSQLPEVKTESAGDILYNAIANVIPPPSREE